MNDWYAAADSPELVEFGPVRGLGASGVGAPGGPEHLAAIQALYAVAAQLLGDRLPPLEGRWWVEDDRPPLTVPRAQWRWHLFVRLPESVEPAAVEGARQATGLPTAARVQQVLFTEGSCVQAMHHGSYDEEPKTLGRIDRFMRERGLVANGLHHELYLSDVRETDPGKMRTILRQPVRASYHFGRQIGWDGRRLGGWQMKTLDLFPARRRRRCANGPSRRSWTA